MASNQILTAAQAQAVYSAMCALDNISVNFDTMWRADDGESVRITENKYGVLVHKGGEQGVSEHYADQAAFAAAYGLDLAAASLPEQAEARPVDAETRAVLKELLRLHQNWDTGTAYVRAAFKVQNDAVCARARALVKASEAEQAAQAEVKKVTVDDVKAIYQKANAEISDSDVVVIAQQCNDQNGIHGRNPEQWAEFFARQDAAEQSAEAAEMRDFHANAYGDD